MHHYWVEDFAFSNHAHGVKLVLPSRLKGRNRGAPSVTNAADLDHSRGVRTTPVAS